MVKNICVKLIYAITIHGDVSNKMNFNIRGQRSKSRSYMIMRYAPYYI